MIFITCLQSLRLTPPLRAAETKLLFFLFSIKLQKLDYEIVRLNEQQNFSLSANRNAGFALSSLIGFFISSTCFPAARAETIGVHRTSL